MTTTTTANLSAQIGAAVKTEWQFLSGELEQHLRQAEHLVMRLRELPCSSSQQALVEQCSEHVGQAVHWATGILLQQPGHTEPVACRVLTPAKDQVEA